MPHAFPLDAWSEFEELLRNHYFALPAARRDQYIFRGQASVDWELLPTIDRSGPFFAGSRKAQLERLLQTFRRL